MAMEAGMARATTLTAIRAVHMFNGAIIDTGLIGRLTIRSSPTTGRASSAIRPTIECRRKERSVPRQRYPVELDEESIDGVAWLDSRRIGAVIHLPVIVTKGSRQQMVPLYPADLDCAFERI